MKHDVRKLSDYIIPNIIAFKFSIRITLLKYAARKLERELVILKEQLKQIGDN